jgi:hypothetical protein
MIVFLSKERAVSPQVTQLLSRWSLGDQSALEELTPLVYDELASGASLHEWRALTTRFKLRLWSTKRI